MAVQVFKFKEMVNVLFISNFNHNGVSVVPLKIELLNPFTQERVIQIYRGTSLRGKQIYYYRPSEVGGEIRGG